MQGSAQCGLSPSQRRLWVASALTGHSGAYHATFSWRILGPLDVEALERALQFVVSQHPSLRTRFLDAPAGPAQVVSPKAEARLERHDLLQGSNVRDSVAEAKRREALRPFDLASDLPVRAQILRLFDESHVLLLSVHYLVVDGTAVGLMLSDLERAYCGFTGQSTLDPVALTDQVAEHLAKLSLIGAASSEEAHGAYWRDRLAGLPPLIDLPVDRPRRSGLGGKGGWIQIAFDERVSREIALLAESTRTSVFSAVAGVVLLLIGRYTGESDLCIGYPVANRNDDRLKRWVGCMVNTLPLRTSIDFRLSFESLVRTLKAQIGEGIRHSSYLVDEVVSGTRRGVRDERSPFAQIILNQNLNYEPTLSLERVEVEPLPRETEEVPFELAWIIVAKSPSLRLRLEYNSDLFDRSTIERMVGHFKTLLQAVVANPQSRVQDLPLLTEAERHQILVEWNDTKADFPQDKCIHQLFEEQVERAPDAVALVFEDQQLSYAQLNAKANQLANHLRGLGVKPDTLVAICIERSLEMVIGLLGILKAGGAYVPLDPRLPSERLAFMLQDTAAPVLLTQADLKERVLGTGAQVVCIDSEWGEIGNCAATNLPTTTSTLNLAYCIYTSGSTGKPKGVLISHSSLVNLILDWMRNEPAAPTDRFSLWTSIGFDVSAWEWLAPMAQGASLAIPTEDRRTDPATFLRWAEATGVTTAYLAPHIARAMTSPSLEGVPVPAKLLLGVEPLNERSLFGSLRSRVVNGYGPTEATVYATAYRQLLQPIDRNLPIGRPISNARIYILDGQLDPVPIGTAGDVHIAGAGLARGYLKRPDLTAEKFIPDPFGEPGSRMYKTGDLGRYRPDGNIEFLGRMDHQVKIRGFRIELGEVEAALQRCDGVREAVVLAREDAPGDRQLVACVVPSSGVPLAAELRHRLSGFLPEFMVPTAWVFLDALPLDPNGKVDRLALSLLQAPPTGQSMPGPPLRQLTGDPILDVVLTVLDELMPAAVLSSEDDLFASGFHSVLVLRFIGACREQFGVKLSFRHVYQLGTAEKIAEAIRSTSRFDQSGT